MSDTPRTDAALHAFDESGLLIPFRDTARTLERELAQEREKVRRLREACASSIREYSVSELREALSATEDRKP